MYMYVYIHTTNTLHQGMATIQQNEATKCNLPKAGCLSEIYMYIYIAHVAPTIHVVAGW